MNRYPETLADLVRFMETVNQDRLCLVDGVAPHTYGEMTRSIRRLARYLKRHAVKPGGRIALVAPDGAAQVAAALATAALGGVFVPIDPRTPIKAMMALIRTSGAERLLTTHGAFFGSFLPAAGVDPIFMEEAAGEDDGPVTFADPGPNDECCALPTSGSMGERKLVVHRHGALSYVGEECAKVWDIEGRDRLFSMIPVMTGATFGSCLIPALSAGAGFSMPGKEKYLPPDDLSPTFVMGNPTHFARALAMAGGWLAVDRGWRGTLAGAPIPPGLAERVFDRLGGALYPHYGMTETLAATSARRPLDETVGKPLPGVDLRIVSADGGEVVGGGEGEIQLKSPARFIRYMVDGAGTNVGSEWFATGDVGSLDPWGNLRLTGRIKNVIIRCGNVVYPEEIERAAAECDDVAECAAVGRPRSEIGEEILLLVVWKNRGNENEEGVRRELAAWAPPYRMPDRIVTVAALPRADSGKIDRERLKIEVRDV